MLVKSTLLLGVVSISLFTYNHKITSETKPDYMVVKNLSNQELSRLPQDIFQNRELRVLDVSRNDLRQLDARMISNKKLVELNLSYNPRLNIEHIVDYLPDSSLEHLNLQACHIPIMPIGMERFSKLKHLDLSDNHLVYLPYDMVELSRLEYLDLSNNQLENLNVCTYGWYNLKEIDVRGNEKLNHKEFISALSLLDNLKLLKLSHVKEVGDDFANLKCRRLEIHQSAELSFNGKLSENQGIQELYLNRALSLRPKQVLQEVNQCMNLTKVKIREDWTVVPRYIQILNSIDELDLSGNRLKNVKALEKLSGLKRLNLNNNPLSKEALADLSEALPNCKIKFETDKPLQPLKLDKPIKNAELTIEKSTVSPTEKQEVEFSSARLTVPSDAFLDENGALITEPVNLEYTEFMNPAQIMLSGIPMNYDSAGVRYNFSSAGMFEINANVNGKPVFPNPEKPIRVDMKSSSSDTDYNLYAFDEQSGQWNLLGKDEVNSLNSDTDRASSDVVTNTGGNKRDFSAKYDSVSVLPDNFYEMQTYLNQMNAYKLRLSENRIKHPKIRAKVKCHKRTNSFTIDLHELTSPKSRHMVASNKRLQELGRGKWIYDGDRYEDIHHYLDSIDRYSMNIYGKYRVPGGVYSLNGPSFIKNVDLKPSADGNTFVLSFNFKDTLIQLNVYPEREDLGSAKQVRKNLSALKRYRVKSYKDTRANRTNKREVRRKNRALIREMKEAGLDETIESLIAFDAREYRKKMVGKKLLASEYLNTKAKPVEASRSFSLFGFGVFNCDRIQRMQDPVPVLAKFVDGKGHVLKAKKVYVLEFDANGVLSYDGDETFQVDKGTSYNIILVLEDDNMAIIQSESMEGRPFNRASLRIPVELTKTKGLSTAEMMKKMMS